MDLHRVDVLHAPRVSLGGGPERNEREREEDGEHHAARAASEATEREGAQHDRERQQVDRVAAFLEGRSAIRRQQGHAEGMRDDDHAGDGKGAGAPRRCDPERAQGCPRQQPVRLHQPPRPFRHERAGPSPPRQRGRLPHTAEPAHEAAFDLGRGRGRKRRADRRPRERHRGREHRHADGHEHRDAPPREPPREQQERKQQQRLGTRERGACAQRRRPRGAVARQRQQRRRHQERRETHLHAGQRAPGDRPHPQQRHPRRERDVGGSAPRQARAAHDERRAQRDRHPERLGGGERSAADEGGRRQQQRPRGRGGARHRHARIVGEAGALGEVAGEVQMNPRVVERKAGAVRDGALAEDEEHEGHDDGEDDERVVSPAGHANARG
jgi:hypothetical protein